MSIAATVRRLPLWLIFIGLIALQLAVMTLVRHSEVYETSLPGKRCMVEIDQVGAPVLYVNTSDSCYGETTDWRWGAPGAVVGGALMLASLVTNTLAERRRGASGRHIWLAALIVGLSTGGLASFAGGLGSSITCHDREGLYAWPFIIFGGLGFTAALIGLGVALLARNHTSRLTRTAAFGAIPAMVAVFIAAAFR